MCHWKKVKWYEVFILKEQSELCLMLVTHYVYVCVRSDNSVSITKSQQTTGYYQMALDGLWQGCQTHFHRGPHQPRSYLQKAKCNFRTI